MVVKIKFDAPKVEGLPKGDTIQFLGKYRDEYFLVHGRGDNYSGYGLYKGKKDNLNPLEVVGRSRARDMVGTTDIEFEDEGDEKILIFIPNSKEKGKIIGTGSRIHLERII